jgi:ketosteroid isomerase-like protein
VACGGPLPFGQAHRAAMVDSVRTMLGQWRDAFNARDFARAASFYSSDSSFRWFENGEMKFRTARELRDTMLAEGPRMHAAEMTLVGPEITAIAPGVAEVTSSFTEKITDSTGQAFGLAGAMTMTVVHRDSGWRFLVGHLSVMPPMPDTLRGAKRRRT